MAKDWYGNGIPVNIQGKLEILQQSEYELTNVEVNLKNLEQNSGYHVHIVSDFILETTIQSKGLLTVSSFRAARMKGSS